jgi:hypothetical protein
MWLAGMDGTTARTRGRQSEKSSDACSFAASDLPGSRRRIWPPKRYPTPMPTASDSSRGHQLTGRQVARQPHKRTFRAAGPVACGSTDCECGRLGKALAGVSIGTSAFVEKVSGSRPGCP